MSDKRTQIIEAAVDLFANHGFWNTPTSRITKHARVSTGTLFNYFESKDALIDEVYMQLKQEQAAHISHGYPASSSLRERVEHLWFRAIDWGIRFPIRYRLLQQMKLSNLVSDEAQQQGLSEWAFAASVTQECVDSGAFRDVSAEFINAIVFSQLEAAVEFAISHQLTDMPLTKHITRTFEIFWAGMTA